MLYFVAPLLLIIIIIIITIILLYSNYVIIYTIYIFENIAKTSLLSKAQNVFLNLITSKTF